MRQWMATITGISMALLGAAPSLASEAAPQRQPPQPHCLDARGITAMRQPDPRTLLLTAADGSHHQLGLDRDCPGLEHAEHAELLGRDGWICNSRDAFVRTGGMQCRVTSVAMLDARQYAARLRASEHDAVATLDRVEVHGQRRQGWHGFRGSYDYCFNPRDVRSWSEDPEGLLIETSPRRSGGHRWYRVELASHCPELDSSPSLQFVSGVGIGLICANPGDSVVASRDTMGAFAGSKGLPGVDNLADPARAASPIASGIRCEVAAVYPQR